ncbi:lung adenoma susceptibility protein 2 isoform X8 [Danio rerio]|uniref:Lung adenoma susceptibility protein 2 isoform X8 n=1 Tax=Danio rerio TaxID=7955 RepID=A0A8M2BI25_DANRE|nr:lung adenoma susceptibility protein 2 isoform X3 [Danio rerio]|eukprot:XP_005170304.1 lung adenoma susceptibility protein 2 isoform X3 [Danio rerio]
MACEERMQSPESGVSSLLASSGRLHSFLHPQPEHIITYRDKHYSSASAALDAYISDYQQSLGSRTLQLHTHTRTRKDTDVLKSSLTDRELSVLNIPTRRDSDRLSLTTDDLLDLPNDGSLPVTRTSALLTRSESFPVEHSFNSRPCSHLRPTFLKCSLCPPAELAKTLHGAHLRSQSKAPPPNILPANQRLPLDTPTYRNLPRWMSSHRVPPWVTELEEGRSQTEVKDHSGEDVSLRELRLQHTHSNTLQTANTPPLFKDDRIGSLILRAEQMLNSPSFAVSDAVKELNASADTEEALDVDRSWDNPPVAFKSPVPVGIAEEPPAAEDLQRSKSAASGSSGYSSRNHPGPVEALKHMLYRLQAVEQKISQSQHSITDSADTAEQQETEAVDAGSGESLLRALHHLERLKTLVDDMNDRKVGAGNDGIDSTDCTRISMHT